MPKSKLIDIAVAAVEELKALDLKLLDVRKLTPMTDYMLICTGTSTRHVKAIADNVALRAKHAGSTLPRVQGAGQSEWVLVDLGEIVVHVMQLQARAFYQLEKLWDMAGPATAETDKSPVKKKPKKKAVPNKKKTKRKSR